MSESKTPDCALSALRRIDPKMATMIAAARAAAKARHVEWPSNAAGAGKGNGPQHSQQDGGMGNSQPLPMVPRVYLASEWPAPEHRSAAPLARGEVQAFSASPRPWCDYVNSATLVRAFITGEVWSGNSLRSKELQMLQYYIDSAFWTRTAPWPHTREPMAEASWMRMPIARVTSGVLEPFIEANVEIWSNQVVMQRMTMLDQALQEARERQGATVRFGLVRQLLAFLKKRDDTKRAA